MDNQKEKIVELFGQMFEKAATEKRLLKALKNSAVKCQQFELAAHLRDVEKSNFPETEEEIKAKVQGSKISLLFRMVELNVSDDICWLIYETIKEHKTKKGKFTLDDAARLIAKRHQLFEIEKS